MPLSKPSTTFLVVAGSLILAMGLRILPFPRDMLVLNPDWVLLFLIYWSMAIPDRVGVVSGWFTGLTTDVLTGRLLGQHGLAYAIVIYCILRLHRQLRLYPLYQQALLVLLFLLLSQILVFWTQNIKGSNAIAADYWLPSVVGAIVWPVIFLVLRYVRRWFNIF